jgi:hypothetical protein
MEITTMSNKGKYFNFKEGLQSKAKLMTLKEIQAFKTDPNKDYYTSIFVYNDTHKKKVDETGSIKGITDVTTNTLVFDFDSTDIEKARQDVLTLGTRLIDNESVDSDSIACYFSGGKGFHVVVPLSNEITPEQFKAAVNKLAGDLPTFDTVVSDPQRILRMEYTKHPKSGLYKIPLHIAEVDEMTVDQIKELAKTPREEYEHDTKPVKFKEDLFVVKEKKKETTVFDTTLDLSKKPRGWQDYVYGILEGHYESGERHQALMVLAAKCRGMGYDKEQTYYLCKSSLKKQAALKGQSEFDKEELYKNIIEDSVYSDRWEGGSFSPKNNPWLAKYCERHSIRWDNRSDANITSVTEAFDSFENFAVNIDKNTIKTGIPGLDEALRLTIGMSVGLVASPGVGKTSVSLQMLNNMSKQGHRCIFFSYDMYAPIVYQKLVQKHFNIGSKAMFEKFKTDPSFRAKVKKTISEEYANISFCFRTGQTVPDIESTIDEVESTTGQRVKFMVVDYNELVLTDYSDATASSSFVAQKMREIAQRREICVFSLFQPSKMSGSPSDEVKSYNAAKGSGAISQSVSVMLGMSRPGYDPQSPENDKFVNLSCLKNRMGPLFSFDWAWNGLTGCISKMSDEEYEDLKKIRERKAAAESTSSGGWS